MTPREYLFSLEQFGIKLGLEQIRALLQRLNRPDLSCRSVVVGGTNGKGSVTAMTERALRAAGLRTGRYTSPHLIHIEERIAINGQAVSRSQFDDAASEVRRAAAHLSVPPTFFEATTALALEIFRRECVDIAVMEVGLGGRLDATNVLRPEGVAITSIDFDHEQYLGHTIEAIAAEKAGIVKPGRLCVLGENGPEARRVVETRCAEIGAPFVFGPEGVRLATRADAGRLHVTIRTPAEDYGEVALGLRGRHQIDNAVTAVRLLEALAGIGAVRVEREAILTGLSDVQWPARLEMLETDGTPVLIDGAHNPSAARALAAYLTETYAQPVPIVFGVMRDKNIGAMVEALAPCASVILCTAPASPRATAADELAALVHRAAPRADVRAVNAPMAALREAARLGSPAVVAGSLYLAGEIRAELT